MTAPSAGRPLRIVRRLPGKPEVIFAAWTDPESLKTWMCPGSTHTPIAELDVRVGGQFRIVMHHGEQVTVHTGVYQEIRPPDRLVFTWSSSATRGAATLVTVELRPQGEDTELVLTHEGFPDEEAATEHDRGWQSIIVKLEAFVRLSVSSDRS